MPWVASLPLHHRSVLLLQRVVLLYACSQPMSGHSTSWHCCTVDGTVALVRVRGPSRAGAAAAATAAAFALVCAGGRVGRECLLGPLSVCAWCLLCGSVGKSVSRRCLVSEFAVGCDGLGEQGPLRAAVANSKQHIQAAAVGVPCYGELGIWLLSAGLGTG